MQSNTDTTENESAALTSGSLSNRKHGLKNILHTSYALCEKETLTLLTKKEDWL